MKLKALRTNDLKSVRMSSIVSGDIFLFPFLRRFLRFGLAAFGVLTLALASDERLKDVEIFGVDGGGHLIFDAGAEVPRARDNRINRAYVALDRGRDQGL